MVVSYDLVFCQVEVSATGQSLVQMNPTECGVCECCRGTSQIRSGPMRKKFIIRLIYISWFISHIEEHENIYCTYLCYCFVFVDFIITCQ